jgi:Ca2+-binding EF-hand superfamily protein
MRWTLSVASLFVALAAQAGTTAPPPARPDRPGIDADGDGIVTREEARSFPRLYEQFDAADKSKDGQLDAAEMDAHREAMREEMRAKAEERWKAADKDGNGALSREEASASMPRMAERFDRFDANGDGSISRDEMHSFRMHKHGR